jgi:Tfp pilus assembly protein PilP
LTFKLTGVIGSRTPLALVEASDGIGYILKPGDTLGDGRVTEITQSTVTFAVAAKSGQAATTTTLRLAQD